jgi:hypothetical protein
MSTDVFLPRLTADFAAAHAQVAPLGADLAAIKAQGLQYAMYALAPFYLVTVVFHLIAAWCHRRERLVGVPTEAEVRRNAMMVKFAIGILGIAAMYKFGPKLSADIMGHHVQWLKTIFYGVFGVFLVLGVLDLVKPKKA